ncbi:MAG: DUF4097 family beta strand repeat-containing protein [Verrucomicrobia bacterium]|nr:DUF4097 family beta strand repeat-containing protein [Verrucomicrobiota bacterium]MDA1068531.1 DUF4097 family beta strand repeat-containing protein [Verrucomicrobiota bacterium]
MHYRKLINLAQWGPFLLSILAGSQLSARIEDKVEEFFATNGAGVLTLELESSRIEIDTYDGSKVTIAITRSLKTGDRDDLEDELNKVDLTFEQSGNNIRCVLRYENKQSGWSWFGGRSSRLNFMAVVRIPRTFDVDAKTSGGSVDLNNLLGNAKLHTSGGSIAMENVDGNVTARTSGGGIRAKDCTGDVEMKTSGGSIKAENVDGHVIGRTSGGNVTINDIRGNADVSTSGGSITLETVAGNLIASTSGGSIKATIAGQPSKDCNLKTSGGSIYISVASNANLQIDASTSGGSVKTDLSLAGVEAKRSSMKGQLNAGGPILKSRTSGGSIHINSI